jgi:uncharacterized membrane protein
LKKNTLRVLILAIIILILLGVSAEYTLLRAPAIMQVQSSSDQENSIISVAHVFQNASFTDGSGSYTFRLGFDYPNTSIASGGATVFKVYGVLTSEQISSFFTRGVSLSLESGSLLVDGHYDNNAKVDVINQASIFVIEFEVLNANFTQGSHSVSARLVLSTIDVDYIGYFTGQTQIVELNGTFSVGA